MQDTVRSLNLILFCVAADDGSYDEGSDADVEYRIWEGEERVISRYVQVWKR